MNHQFKDHHEIEMILNPARSPSLARDRARISLAVTAGLRRSLRASSDRKEQGANSGLQAGEDVTVIPLLDRKC
jgi:hypothetical protein